MTAVYTDHLGNEYPSRSAMCRAYGISLDLFNHRKKYGWTLEAALTTPVGAVRRGKSATDDKGSAFSSIKEMCRAHNISETTYISRIRSGWTQERALSVPVDKELRGRSVRDHLGQEYPSITKMCEHYGISEALYSYRRKKGWSVEDALTRPASRGKGQR